MRRQEPFFEVSSKNKEEKSFEEKTQERAKRLRSLERGEEEKQVGETEQERSVRELEHRVDERHWLMRLGSDVGEFFNAGEFVKAPLHGGRKAGEEILKTVSSAAKYVGAENVASGLEWTADAISPPEWLTPKTGTGKIVSGGTQFLVPFTGVNKVIKGAKGASYVKSLIAGGITDAVAFDPYEEGLSELGLHYGPEALKPLFTFLGSDKTDGETLGRLKNALEGALGGVAVDGVIRSAVSLKHFFTHKQRVAGLMGDTTYQENPAVVDAARNITHAQERLAGPEDSVLPSGKGDSGTTERLPAAEADWASVLQSEAWQKLPEAARQDLERLIDPTLCSERLAKVFAEDRLRRAEASQEKITATLNLANQRLPGAGYFADVSHVIPHHALASSAGLEETAHLLGRGLNLKVLQTETDTKAFLSAFEHDAAPVLNKVRGQRERDAEIKNLADLLGQHPGSVEKTLTSLFETSDLMAAKVTACNLYLHSLLARFKESCVAYDKGLLGGEALGDHQNLEQLCRETLAQFQGLRSNMGRGFRALNLPLTPDTDYARSRTFAKFVASTGSLEEVSRLMRPATPYTKARDGVLDYWMNWGLLSNPETHVANMLGNAQLSLWFPLERTMAGLVSGNKETRDEGLSLVKHLFLGVGDVIRGISRGGQLHEDNPIKLAAKAFQTKEDFGGLGKIEPAVSSLKPEYVPDAIEAGDFGGAFGAIYRSGLQWGSKLVNLPGRLLTTEDAFFKALNAKTYLRMRADRMARATGGDFETVYRETLLDKKLQREALDYAEKTTLTTALDPNGLGALLTRFRANHPESLLVAPFIRFPANLLTFMHHRTPGLNLLSKRYREAFFSPDPVIREEAFGKMAMGSLMLLTGVGLAMQGKIIGGVPKNRQEASRNAGILPYSFVIREKDTTQYIQYSRLDPVGMFLGTAADVAEVMQDHDENDNLVTAAIIAISQNLSSKTWFTGVSQVLNALQDGDRFGTSLLKNYARTLVPAILRHARKELHPIQGMVEKNPFNDVGDLLDFYKNELPGLSQDVPERLNIFGEEVRFPEHFGPAFLSPIKTTTAPDPVAEEMYRLDMTANPPSNKIEGVHLTPTQHQQYIRLSAKVEDRTGSYDLKTVLGTLMQKESWKTLYDDEKVKAFEKVIAAFRSAGKRSFLAKNPDIRDAIRKQHHHHSKGASQ